MIDLGLLVIFHTNLNENVMVGLLQLKTPGRGYSHIKAYEDVSFQWVTFSQVIPRHGSQILQKYPKTWARLVGWFVFLFKFSDFVENLFSYLAYGVSSSIVVNAGL